MKLIDELKWAKGKSTKCRVNKTSFPTFASFLPPLSAFPPSFLPPRSLFKIEVSLTSVIIL